MLEVNKEKILQDYKELNSAREQKLAEIEQAAKDYAIKRGYDEKQTANFVEFAQSAENGGLTKQEKAKFDILSEYIFEKEEVSDIIAAGNVEVLNG